MKSWYTAMLTILILGATALAAAPPKTISYQGYLKDAAGKPVAAATNMAFRLYSTTSGVNPVWTEGQTVTPVNGVYSVELGSVASMNFYRGQQFYLGVKVGSDPEMRPLQKLAAAPYSLALSLPLYQSMTSPAAALYINNAAGPAFQGTSDQPNMYAIYGRNHYGTGVSGESQFQTGVSGSSVSTGTGVWGWSQDGIGIKGGNSSPTAPTMELTNYDTTPGSLLLRGQAGSSPATVFQVTTVGKVIANGVQSSNAVGNGISGSSGADYGVWGQSSGNAGVYGANATSGNFGYLGGSSYGAVGYSANSTGVLGQSNTSAGVYGSSATGNGVFGENTGASSGMAGVYGRASNTSGTTYGLLGECDSFTSYAVQGTHVPTNNYGYMGSNGAGAYGRHSATGNNGSLGSASAGVRGSGTVGVFAANSTNGAVSASLATTTNAGEFTGDVLVKGNIMREYTAGVARNAAPVAFGNIASDGTIDVGTGNFTVVWNATGKWYEITIAGENYHYMSYATLVTPASSIPLIATTSSVSGKLIVQLFNMAGVGTQSVFSFVVFKQ
jgi:hypothetical protein